MSEAENQAVTTESTKPNNRPTSVPPIVREKPVIPEGMSKSEWKRQQKKKMFVERKAEFLKIRREKKKAARANRRAKIQEYIDRGEEVPQELLQKRRQRLPENQDASGIEFVIDCAFDDLMSQKERISLSTQITRSYSANRFAQHTAEIKVMSFNKLLKERFQKELKDSNWENWDHVKFHEEEFEPVVKEKCIYLSSDATEALDTLEPGMTYVIGGIVDKGRYKNLCKDKAEKMGLVTKRLPIDEYIVLNGRRVLTTTHVVDLMLKWLEFKDWKKAFNTVLPPRKLLGDKESDNEDEDDEDEDDDEYEEQSKTEV